MLYTKLPTRKMGLMIMRRSKLELHIDILRSLAHHGPLILTHIMYKANVNCTALKEYLEFLIQHTLIAEQTLLKRRCKTKLVYTITERGLTALKYFRELNSALQVDKEALKIPMLLR